MCQQRGRRKLSPWINFFHRLGHMELGGGVIVLQKAPMKTEPESVNVSTNEFLIFGNKGTEERRHKENGSVNLQLYLLYQRETTRNSLRRVLRADRALLRLASPYETRTLSRKEKALRATIRTSRTTRKLTRNECYANTTFLD